MKMGEHEEDMKECGKKMYVTYKLPQGGYQTTAIFFSREEAEEIMKYHAQGRRYIIAESEAELEELKKEESKESGEPLSLRDKLITAFLNE